MVASTYSGWILPSSPGQNSRGRFGGHVPSRDDADHLFPLALPLTAATAAAPAGSQASLALVEEPERVLDLLLRDEDDVLDAIADDLGPDLAPAWGELSPSAIDTGSPRPARRPRAPSASPLRARARRRPRARPAAATAITPEMRPPPPMGTTIVSTSGQVLEDLEAHGALAGDRERVVPGVDERPAGFLQQDVQSREGLAGIACLEVDRGAVPARRRDLRLARPRHMTTSASSPSSAAPQATACA